MFLIVHILIFIALVLGGQACDLKGIACLNSTTYQICRKYGDEVVYLGSPKTCSKGLGCHETIGFFPCIDESYIPATTTARPVANCDSGQSVKFVYYDGNVLNCDKYYECVKVFWWWELQTKTCASGTRFSALSLDCQTNISPDTCNPDQATTVAPGSTTPPPQANCNDNVSKKIPYYNGNVQDCTKYYQCEKDWIFWWYNLREKSCPSGTAFSSDTLQCDEGISLDTCKPYVTTTLPTTTVITTPRATPNCDENKSVRFPYYDGNVQNCAKYYQCEKDWLFPWYNLKEKSCSSGTAFYSVTLECEENISLETCKPPETTTVTTTTTTTLPTTTTKRPTPNCNDNKSIRFPFYDENTLNCGKYYQCEKDWIFPWYNLKEKTCATGTAFSTVTLQCESTISPDTCKPYETTTLPTTTTTTTTTPSTTTPSTTTLSTTTTLRPKPNCDENKSIRFAFYNGNVQDCTKYYQCEKDWIFPYYDLKEKTCPSGTGFSSVTLECDATISLDTCKPYETTTLPTTTTTAPTTTTPSTTTQPTTTTIPPKPNCDDNKSVRYPFYEGSVLNCAKYYECEKDWIFPYYDLKEKTCPSGTGFSSVTLECEATISLDTCKPYETTTLPTTTTTPPTTTTPSTTTQPTTTTIPSKPNCDDNKSVRYPFYEGNVLNCAKYYECEKDWIFPYYDLKEKTCPSGTGFSSVSLECEATISLDTCKPYETTTLPTTTTTPPTTTIPSTTTQPTTTTIPSKPNCDDNKSVRYPFYEGNVLNCAKYYECEKDWIFPYYDLKEKSCPSGTGFSSVTLECESTISIDTCESIETTSSVTTPTSTTTSSTTIPPTTALPTTTTPRPTPNCNENKSVTFPFYNGNILNCAKYYACEKDWIFPWYNLKEKTCPSGTGFSIITLECLSTISPQTCA